MFSACMDKLKSGLCTAQEYTEQGLEIATDKVNEARTKAGQHTLQQLRVALEGSVVRAHDKPDVDITILKVDFQDGLNVDIFNFSLSGLKCRVRMDAKGSAAEIAAMAAADAAKGAVKKVSKLTGGFGESLAQGFGALRDSAHSGAADSDVKSVEFDVNLDLGVRKAGEEVSTAVSIVGDALDEVDKIIPIKTATQYVEKAIADKVKEIITTWAKEQVKSRVGVDVDGAKAKINEGMDKLGLR